MRIFCNIQTTVEIIQHFSLMKKRITWNSAQTWTLKIVHHHGTQATLICSHIAIRILRKCGSTRAGCGYPHLRSGFGLTCCRGEQIVVDMGQTRLEKFFVRITECSAKAHGLNQLKICKARGCTDSVHKLFASIALTTVGLQQLLHCDVTSHCCETFAQAIAMPCESDHFPMLCL